MAVGKEIRTQISSIKNTQKITSAMEMVAASKMRKAQDRMQLGKPYAQRIRAVIGHIAHATPEYHHVFFDTREVKRVGYIVVSTDRGLCGGLNTNLFKATVAAMKANHDANVEVDVCAIGAKSMNFFKNYGGSVLASVRDMGEKPEAADIVGVVKVMLDKFENGELDQVFVVSNEFVNTMTQQANVQQLLPLEPSDEDELKGHWDYLYEPDAQELLDRLDTLDRGADGLEVRKHAAEPTLVDVRHAALVSEELNWILCLLLGSDEQDASAVCDHVANKLV